MRPHCERHRTQPADSVCRGGAEETAARHAARPARSEPAAHESLPWKRHRQTQWECGRYGQLTADLRSVLRARNLDKFLNKEYALNLFFPLKTLFY